MNVAPEGKQVTWDFNVVGVEFCDGVASFLGSKKIYISTYLIKIQINFYLSENMFLHVFNTKNFMFFP